MRVLVDGWELQPGGRRRGIGRFLDGVLPEVSALDDMDVAVLQHTAGPDEVPAGTTPARMRRVVPRGRIRAGIVEHVARLPLDLATTAHDVFWSPGTLPPLRTPGPWLQTMHDLAPLALDHPAYRFARRQWRLLGPRVRHADAVVAVSRFAADEAIRLLDLDPARVEVVPHGVGPAFHPGDTPGTGTVPSRGGPYLVSVCTPDPRKGWSEAAAVADAVRSRGHPHVLRIAGGLPDTLRRRLDAAESVQTCGFVDDLPALLRGADVAVVTTRYEGFGFAALEAMACGTPVVAFDNTAVTEVVGDGGILVPDGDTASMAAAVHALLDDASERGLWRQRALDRARCFTWPRAAAAYAEVLRALR